MVANALTLLSSKLASVTSADSAAAASKKLRAILFGIRKNVEEHGSAGHGCPVCVQVIRVSTGIEAALDKTAIPSPALCRHVATVLRELAKLVESNRSSLAPQKQALVHALCLRAIKQLQEIDLVTHAPTFRDVLG